MSDFDWVEEIAPMPVTIDTATNGDELLTALAAINPDYRWTALSSRGIRILREAADLCGIDAEGLGRVAAINAIIDNF